MIRSEEWWRTQSRSRKKNSGLREDAIIRQCAHHISTSMWRECLTHDKYGEGPIRTHRKYCIWRCRQMWFKGEQASTYTIALFEEGEKQGVEVQSGGSVHNGIWDAVRTQSIPFAKNGLDYIGREPEYESASSRPPFRLISGDILVDAVEGPAGVAEIGNSAVIYTPHLELFHPLSPSTHRSPH